MLQRLYIANYAIIDELEIEFSKGMNIITGETGAGKSIIIGALQLILGERADSSVLVNKEKKCIIEGRFLPENTKAIFEFLKENDLDQQAEILVRREIAVNGKSRAFINDTPVGLAQLQGLGALCVDLHQQFDNQTIGDSSFQTEVLDVLAANQKTLQEYQKLYRAWWQSSKKLKELQQQLQQFEKESGYNQFQYDELAAAGFREQELEQVDAELKLLSNAEAIKTTLNRAYQELEENEPPMVQQLKSLANQLSAYSAYHQELPAIVERLYSAQVELQDIASELKSVNDHIHYDAQKIEQLNDRLTLGYKLLKKHGVQTTQELLIIQNQFAQKLQLGTDLDDTIKQLASDTEALQEQALTTAEKISEKRKKQIRPLEVSVHQLLAQVGMPNAQLKVMLQPDSLAATGKDKIEFLFDANKSGQFKPINKVASGGELSRLMLCIKSLVAQSMELPTLIFDEIDTGISGEAAKQVGLIMKGLAGARQVICITHQPQIAAKADTHYFVYKKLTDGVVKAYIRVLNHEERVNTIAQMLGGEKPTIAALENAREMVAT